jgi:hypothetical protein
MSQDPAPLPPPDEDDHDVLTFGLAGNRLENELRRVQAEIERAEAATAGDVRLEDLRIRLAMLEEAARRNAAPPITDATFEKFFGYRGTPRTSKNEHESALTAEHLGSDQL